MSKPKPVTRDVARQLYLAGRVMGATVKNNHYDVETLKEIDPDLLQAYLDSKPEGFLYAAQVSEVIRVARTVQSLSLPETEPSPPLPLD